MPGRQGKEAGACQKCGGVQLLGSFVSPGLLFDEEEQGQSSLVFRVLRFCRSVSTAQVPSVQGQAVPCARGAAPEPLELSPGWGRREQTAPGAGGGSQLCCRCWTGWAGIVTSEGGDLTATRGNVCDRSLSSVFPFLQHPGGFRTGFLQEHKKMGLLLNDRGVWCWSQILLQLSEVSLLLLFAPLQLSPEPSQGRKTQKKN